MQMGLIYFLPTLLVAFLTTYFGVEFFRRWSLKKNLLDLPNERSSHKDPTPRGGGLIIFLTVIVGYIIVGQFYPTSFSWAFVIAATLIAAISWLDDVRSVSFLIRILVHSFAALLVMYKLGYWGSIQKPFFTEPIELGFFGAVITFGWIVWFLNAYNFMDGIDGIAGTQALTAAIAWTAFGILFGYPGISIFSGVIAVSSLGFLLHNWAPAKIFMGDVGSAFLGFTFAVLPLIARQERHEYSELLPYVSLIFVVCFVVDAAMTMFVRLLTAQKIWTPHRQHIYQRLVISGIPHSRVTLIYGLISVLAVATFLAFGIIDHKLTNLAGIILISAIASLVALRFKSTFNRENEQ